MIVLFPRWWRRVIDQRLADWDERLASDRERSIVHARGWAIPFRPDIGLHASDAGSLR